MMHDYHDGLPGFDERQLLHDGCGECDTRGQDPLRVIQNMDLGNFDRAWDRARLWNLGGHKDEIGEVSRAEVPTLRILAAVRLKLEAVGRSH